MTNYKPGDIILIPFPFSDLSFKEILAAVVALLIKGH